MSEWSVLIFGILIGINVQNIWLAGFTQNISSSFKLFDFTGFLYHTRTPPGRHQDSGRRINPRSFNSMKTISWCLRYTNPLWPLAFSYSSIARSRVFSSRDLAFSRSRILIPSVLVFLHRAISHHTISQYHFHAISLRAISHSLFVCSRSLALHNLAYLHLASRILASRFRTLARILTPRVLAVSLHAFLPRVLSHCRTTWFRILASCEKWECLTQECEIARWENVTTHKMRMLECAKWEREMRECTIARCKNVRSENTK